MGMCHELGQQLLVSDGLLALIDPSGYHVVEKGEMQLRGKEEKIRLFGVKRRND